MINVTSEDVARLWPVPCSSADKYSRGIVGIDTGSRRYPGAGVLSVLGALYSGAGFIRYVGAEDSQSALLGVAPSVTFGRGRVSAWLVGCGWDEDQFNHERMLAAVSASVPMVIDAGALWVMPPKLPEGSLLTPHAGELARLLGTTRRDVEENPDVHALEAARLWNASVLVKGEKQYVAHPQGKVGTPVSGPAWTAQAGSGDVLAGIAATLLASGLDGFVVGLVAASVQAMVAAMHRGPYPPQELVRFLPEVIGGFEGASFTSGVFSEAS